MKVDVKIEQDLKQPYAVVYTSVLTPDLLMVIELLENAGEVRSDVITGKQNDRVFILEAKNIEMIRAEGKEIAVYDTKGVRYQSTKRIYELESSLGPDFIRISKSALVNLKRIDHVDVGFGGALDLVMKNQIHEYISRRFVAAFKKRLGL
ncbi:MAG: LytTR family transcriptional regulator [Erysipelotrichaceae bacterium]|jgi:DNA-binding LytR/AlgR family response regulator|nr:LytTR family transcriptional regulator [Erysipelotrichaceae bacterium]